MPQAPPLLWLFLGVFLYRAGAVGLLGRLGVTSLPVLLVYHLSNAYCAIGAGTVAMFLVIVWWAADDRPLPGHREGRRAWQVCLGEPFGPLQE